MPDGVVDPSPSAPIDVATGSCNVERAPRGIASIVLGGLSGLVLVLYPLVVYAALRWTSPRVASLVLLVVLVPGALLGRARRGTTSTNPLRSLAWVPLVVVAMLVTSAVVADLGGALMVPVVTNGALLFAFGGTLWRPPPMIERFARVQVADLSAPEQRWCRGWTWAWCGLFFLNAGVAGTLAWTHQLEAWTTYNGLVAYVLMGLMFGIEYTIRKAKFGRWRGHMLDRILRRGLQALGCVTPGAHAA